MTAQMTGGNPKTTGVFYDVEYNHALLAAGHDLVPRPADRAPTSSTTRRTTSTSTGWTPVRGSPGLPGSILQMTSTAAEPARTRRRSRSTRRRASRSTPSQYLKVNTIFNVAHDAGLLTAWSDKHPVYTSFNGPSGNGITDSFDPEIDCHRAKPDGTP